MKYIPELGFELAKVLYTDMIFSRFSSILLATIITKARAKIYVNI